MTSARSLFAALLATATWAASGGAALAQQGIPNPMDPGSTTTPDPGPPPALPGLPAPAPAPGPPQEGGAPAGDSPGGEGGGIYLGDDSLVGEGDKDADGDGVRYLGPTPGTHVVRTGDTLWDICQYYFNNPWDWPKVWSFNPAITNPHWIYPGDQVRLYPAGQAPGGEGDVQPAANAAPEARMGTTAAPTAQRVRGASLRQIAFVDDDELKFAGTIIGSSEEKMMLTPGDEVYIEYPEGKPPQIGQRYAIYTDPEPIKHPETGARVGAYVTLHGEVRITEVKKGRKARAFLTYATDVIERGMRVGPTRTQFKDVAARAPERDLEGVIIAILATDQLIGENQVIFIDRGADDGLKPGNQMRVLRRGDAYSTKMGPGGNAGQDNRQFPDADIGQIVVVEVGKKSSIAFVTGTVHEIEIGDHVMMRRQR